MPTRQIKEGLHCESAVSKSVQNSSSWVNPVQTKEDPSALDLKLGLQGERGLGAGPSHFAKTVIREILGLTFFDSL
jgi:hypothetical protein